MYGITLKITIFKNQTAKQMYQFYFYGFTLKITAWWTEKFYRRLSQHTKQPAKYISSPYHVKLVNTTQQSCKQKPFLKAITLIG